MRAFVLLALAVQACAVSTPTPPRAAPLPEPQTFEEAVPFCVAKVNRKAIYFQFDAHVQPDHVVSTFGSSAQEFEFKKCMNEHGYTLSTATAAEKRRRHATHPDRELAPRRDQRACRPHLAALVRESADRAQGDL
jgi:hypothetical protein